MSTSTTRASHALLALLLSLALAISCMTLCSPQAHADELDTISEKISAALAEGMTVIHSSALMDDSMASDFYFAQSGSGRCTITSVAMMIRRAAFLDERADWRAIDAASVTADGWTRAGVKNEFTSAGYSVGITDIDGTRETLLAMLKEHPEGVAVYDPGVPHAVLLTDYDEQNDTFYCADPAAYYSGKRIPLADSWNGECHGKSQDAVIAGFSQAWVIK